MQTGTFVLMIVVTVPAGSREVMAAPIRGFELRHQDGALPMLSGGSRFAGPDAPFPLLPGEVPEPPPIREFEPPTKVVTPAKATEDCESGGKSKPWKRQGIVAAVVCAAARRRVRRRCGRRLFRRFR